MEEKKSKKGLIIAIILLITIALGGIGYFVYDNYFKPEEPKEIVETAPVEEEKEVEDFYSVSNLIKNKYIKLINSQDEQISNYIKIENGIVKIYDNNSSNFKEAKGIEGTPKTVAFKAIQDPTNGIYLVITEEGNLYYSTSDNFTKINNEKVLNIYDLYNDQIISYPQDVESTLYVELESGDLMIVNQETQMTKTFKETWTYTDKICGFPGGDGYCPGLVISSERALATEKYDENKNVIANAFEEIKYEDQIIKVKDAFTIINEDDYTNKYYIISMDNQLFEIVQKNYKIESIKLYKEQKVKDFVFNYVVEEDSMPKFKSVEITYEDNSNETFKNIFAISTLYERYNK